MRHASLIALALFALATGSFAGPGLSLPAPGAGVAEASTNVAFLIRTPIDQKGSTYIFDVHGMTGVHDAWIERGTASVRIGAKPVRKAADKDGLLRYKLTAKTAKKLGCKPKKCPKIALFVRP